MGRYDPGVSALQAQLNTIQTIQAKSFLGQPANGQIVWSAVNAGGVGATLDVLFYCPILLGPCTITDLGVEVTSVSLTGVARLGLYDSSADSTSVPGALIAEASSTVPTTGLGVVTAAMATPIEWDGGVLWAAAVAQVETASLMQGTLSPERSGLPAGTAANIEFPRETGVSGALPAVAAPNNYAGSVISVALVGA